jgi:hypothetical protein
LWKNTGAYTNNKIQKHTRAIYSKTFLMQKTFEANKNTHKNNNNNVLMRVCVCFQKLQSNRAILNEKRMSTDTISFKTSNQ